MKQATDFPRGYGKGDVPVPVTGGCLCGQLRYSAEAEPLLAIHCSCSRCQKISGTDHGSHLVFDNDSTTISGSSENWSYEADSGARTSRHFCIRCGTHLFARTTGHPKSLVITASSLDEPAYFRPTLHVFLNDRPVWANADCELMGFAGAPV